MNSPENQLVESFLKTLLHLSKHTRDAYRRDLNYLQNYCIEKNIEKWSALKERHVREFISY